MSQELSNRKKDAGPTLDERREDLEWATAFNSAKRSFLRGRLAYGAFVSIKNHYLYVETPKNACTKTKHLLWQLECLPHRPGGPKALHERLRYDGRPSLLDLGCDGARQVLDDPAFFKFCFFRDPIARLVSGYRDRLKENAKIVAAILERFDLRRREDIEFSHFARLICSQDDSERDPHYASQWSLNMADRINYDFVGRTENYSRDMAYILRKLDAPEDLIATVGQKIHTSAGPEVNVEPETVDLIKETYAQDHRLLDFNG